MPPANRELVIVELVDKTGKVLQRAEVFNTAEALKYIVWMRKQWRLAGLTVRGNCAVQEMGQETCLKSKQVEGLDALNRKPKRDKLL